VDTLRRIVLFLLGVFLLIYAMSVHPVQIALVVAAFLLMGVVTWDQLAGMIRRNGHTEDTDVRHPER